MAKPRGFFVTIDGPNGVGKTTLLRGVAEQLTAQGLPVFETKEPTRSFIGQIFREAEEDYPGLTLACLAAADRYLHLEREVEPMLSDGYIVLSDRYVESSLVLQRLDGIDLNYIWLLNQYILRPDLSIDLWAAPETLEQRLAHRQNWSRFERTKTRVQEIQLYHEAVKFLQGQGYQLMELENDRTVPEVNVEKIVRFIVRLRKQQASCEESMQTA